MSGHKPFLALPRKGGITPSQFRGIATFCAEEVGRQYAGYGDCKEACGAVGWMIDAWLDAVQRARLGQVITVPMIEEWGRRIEPEVNANGFRTVKIWVGTREGMNPWHIQSEMIALVDRLPTMDADDAYLAFETIHPFGDGNGRTGKVILNYLKGRLLAPVMPPNFWGCSNP
jgi:hypothetical protein